jgi:hypothetical protein
MRCRSFTIDALTALTMSSGGSCRSSACTTMSRGTSVRPWDFLREVAIGFPRRTWSRDPSRSRLWPACSLTPPGPRHGAR